MPEMKKILYATDLSKNAAFAFRHAVYLARQTHAEIRVLHVVEKISPDAQLALQAYLDREARQKFMQERIGKAIARIKKRLEIFCERELDGTPGQPHQVTAIDVCEGYPAEEILHQAETRQCDMIIMGAHEKGFTHTFLGSVAKRVLRRSRIPTLIIPLPSTDNDLSMHDE